MTIIELQDGTCVSVREALAEALRLLASDAPFVVLSGVNGAPASVNPALVVDVREDRV
jgi:hypothetical protein